MKKFVLSMFLIFLIVFSLGCIGGKSAKNGDYVSIIYSATVNGEMIDDNKGAPLTFLMGSGQVVKGMELGVLGMKVGEEKTFLVSPEYGYGVYKNELVRYEPISNLNKLGINATEGSIVYSVLDKNRMRGVITDLNETHAKIDFNNALAGKEIDFNVKVVSITS